MTLEEFSGVFGVLAIQLRATDADEATIRAYYEALKGLDLELVQMAAQRFAGVPGDNEAWFPKTAEWQATVAKITADHTEELRARLRSRPVALCLACGDTGWAPSDNGVTRCDCQELRRLEIIGRRPMPERVVNAVPERPTALIELTALIRPKAMPAARLRDRISGVADWRADPTLDRDDPIIAAELAKGVAGR